MSKVKTLTEELGDIDKKANTELNGSDDAEGAINLDDIVSGDVSKDAPQDAQAQSLEVPTDDIKPEPAEQSDEMQNVRSPDDLRRDGHDGFTLSNVSGQIDGMVKNWFKFAVNLDPEKKEKFLALGERLSEISDMIKKDFQ